MHTGRGGGFGSSTWLQKPRIFAHRRPVPAGADHRPLTAGAKRTGPPALYPRTWRLFFFSLQRKTLHIDSQLGRGSVVAEAAVGVEDARRAQRCPGATEWAQRSALKQEETKPHLASGEMWGPEILLLGMRPYGKYFYLRGRVG